MSSIQSLGISGVRGYTPQNYQRIEFMKPLTLIWGKNGSGKTTIIECLKYITTGSLPPNSDKGKSFIMDTKVAGRPQVIGDIRLIFKVGNRAILAKRRIQLSAKGQQLKFQSIEQVLKTKGQKGEQLTINHQCAEIQKQVPQFLGISKPILENIVFCHQDESLWPFGDSVLLKNIFDQLFETKKITKEMERMWDIVKQQQTQLKQLKIRLQYQKQTYKKQMQERTKLFIQLQQIEIKSKELKETKKLIRRLKQELKDNTEKIKQRQKLIQKKGKMENSISNLQSRMKNWKQTIYRIQKDFQSKMKGKNIQYGMDQNSFGISSRSHGMGSFNDKSLSNITNFDIEKVQMIEIQSAQSSIEQLESKKYVYQSLKQKYRVAKQQHENLKNFTESSKREQQIKSQIQRIKSLVPQLKYNKDVKNEEDFLKLVKSHLNLMDNKIKGKQMAKRKLERMEIPAVVETGFSDKEVEQLRKQSKELQSDIKLATLTILRIYQAQYKAIPNSIYNVSQLESLQKQVENIEAILKSKEQELQHYKKQLLNRPVKDRKSLEQQYSHYKYAGIELQEEMLHFCEVKGKCYFCSKQMSKKDIQTARQKVNVIKIKTQQRLNDIQNKMKNQSDANLIDPQIMVKKLTQQINKLQTKLQTLKPKISKMQQARVYEKQIQLNKALSKELQKCNLRIQMLSKLQISNDPNLKSDHYYKEVTLQKFQQMSSMHQIKMARYKGVKDQITKLQSNQQKNQLNRLKRQEMLKQKKELQSEIQRTQEEVRHFDFLKNSAEKLEPLIRMQTKSKQKKMAKQGKSNSLGSSSEEGLYSSVEEAAHGMDILWIQILEVKFYIQKLQISINYHNDSVYLREEKQRYQQLMRELQRLTLQLKTSQRLMNQYNINKVTYQKQSERLKHRLSTISQQLSQPLESQYLITLTKIKHLQASISNLQLLYFLMQEAVSQYHSQKMQEINQYIYEVWRQIYHGQDIQYIEIEASSEQNSKKKKKNYQYKILMKKSTKNFKNQQKVEMKGRCSTGQKVLASIVIRLALAEVFCGSTRILALDQPTTNLDRQHIVNLAKALLRLIELSGGKNLQLIIISHDIEFIQLLESYAECYYQVKRDQNRFSTIEKKYIREILNQTKPIG